MKELDRLGRSGIARRTLSLMAGIVLFVGGLSTYSSSTHPTRITIPLEPDLEDYSGITYEEEYHYFASLLAEAYKLDRAKSIDFAQWIMTSSLYNNVPKQILAGVIMTESSFRINVTSRVGATGPAQVRPIFWEDECSGDLTNPSDNIDCAGLILRRYYEKYCEEDWQCALKTYNVGPTNLKRSSYYRQAGQRYLEKVEVHIAWLDGENKRFL